MKLPLESITLGERRREDYGDITGLAASIEKFGLLHPIVVDDAGVLVAGERRLRAAQLLGMKTIECHDIGEVSEAWREEVELAENDDRKDLTSYERAKETVRKAKRVAPIISAKLAEKVSQSPTSKLEVGESRPERRTYDAPKADVAAAIGTSVGSLVRAEQHVETAEKYPELQAPGWKPYHVLEARERLEKLPEPDRPKAVALVSKPGIPPKDAIEIIGSLARRPAPERERIFQKAESADSRDQSDALTEAANLPPMPDQRINVIGRAIEYLRKAEQMFADDPMNASIGGVRTAAIAVRDQLREYRRDA